MVSYDFSILVISQPFQNRFCWTWEIFSGMTRWPESNIFSNLSSHLIWALCGQDPRLWLKFSTIISYRAWINGTSSQDLGLWLVCDDDTGGSVWSLMPWFEIFWWHHYQIFVCGGSIWGWQLSNATTGHLGARNEDLNNSNDKMRGSPRLML